MRSPTPSAEAPSGQNAPAAATAPEAPPADNGAAKAAPPSPSASTPPSGDAKTLEPKTQTDAGWQTYTNKIGSFTLQIPNKGSYAPTWEVSYPSANDPACQAPGAEAGQASRSVSVNGQVFCIAYGEEGAAGSVYKTAKAETTANDKRVAISFTVRTTRAANYDNPACKDKDLVLGSSCVAFDPAAFDDRIDQILATYVPAAK